LLDINSRPHRKVELYPRPEYESHRRHEARQDKWRRRPSLKGKYALRGVSVEPDDLEDTTSRIYAPPRVYGIIQDKNEVHGVLLGRDKVREILAHFDDEMDIYEDYR
jgi:hypothetical protein